MDVQEIKSVAPTTRRWLRWVVYLFILVALVIALPFAWNRFKEYQAEAELATVLADLDAKEPGWRNDPSTFAYGQDLDGLQLARNQMNGHLSQSLTAANTADSTAIRSHLEQAWSTALSPFGERNSESAIFGPIVLRASFLVHFEQLLSRRVLSQAELLDWQQRFEAANAASETMLVSAIHAGRAQFHHWMSAITNANPAEFSQLVSAQYTNPLAQTWGSRSPVLNRWLVDWLNRPPLSPLPAEHAAYLRYQTEVLEIVRRPETLAQRQAAIKALNATVETRPLYTRLRSGVFMKVISAHQKCLASLRAMILLVACERYRLDHGRWPADAATLTPKYLSRVPADPYTDQPMQLKQDATGIRVDIVGSVAGPFSHRLHNPASRRPAESE